MLVLANVFWGLSFPLIKGLERLQVRLVPGSSGAFITLCAVAPRFMVALVLLALLSLLDPAMKAKTTRKEWKQGLTMGLLIGIGLIFQIDGLRFASASTSAFLTQFYAILIPIWIALRHRRSPGPVVWFCCILVLTGVGILGHFDWKTMRLGRGEIETLVSSLFFMGPIFCLEDPANAGNRAGKITLVMFGVQAAMFAAALLVVTPGAAALVAPWKSPPWLGMTLALSVFCSLGAFWLMSRWQPYISATEAGLIYCLEPVFASILALFLPGVLAAQSGITYANERPTLSLVLGGGLITLANVLIQLKPAPLASGHASA
jgi:drug/metabolite transporter (DMT)-like permease